MLRAMANPSSTIAKRVASKLTKAQGYPEPHDTPDEEYAGFGKPPKGKRSLSVDNNESDELIERAGGLDAEEFESLVEGLAKHADRTAQYSGKSDDTNAWHIAASYLHQAASAISKRSGN